MDRYLAMECFCRIVETGSFAAAARDLNCSRSVISKYIAFLEQWTQSRLLARTTRQMQLTSAGEHFYAYCRRAACETGEMLQRLKFDQQQLTGRLVVEAPVSLTLAAMSAHFLAFQAAYPGITLDVRLNDNVSDLVREGVDVALRARADLDDSSLIAIPLAQIERVVCGAPAYLAQHGMPAAPSDLERLNCLSYVLGSDAQSWEFSKDGNRFSVAAGGSLRSNNSLLLVEAMLQGVGIGLVPNMIVESHLRSGRLVPVLSNYRSDARTLFAVYPSRSHLPQKVSAFIQFLKSRLQA
jgi:DNA-binding transcriptional LysR family regulator